METRISGFQEEGSWAEVVGHGDHIAHVLRNLGATAHPRMDREGYSEALQEWDDWRPRESDSLEDDIGPRTAQQASLPPSQAEERGRTARRDLHRAWYALLHGPETVPDGGATEWMTRLAEAARLSTRAAGTGMRGLFRSGEEAIYLHLMTKLSPYYFDNRIISANIDRVAGDDGMYRFEIDINSDRLKERVQAEMGSRPSSRPA